LDIDFAFVCDYGDVSTQKLVAFNIGFNVLRADAVPFTHAPFYFVAQLRAEQRDAGHRTLQVRFIGSDGDIYDIPVPIFVQQPYPDEKPVVRIAVVFPDIEFRRYGPCEVLLMDGNRVLSTVTFDVAPGPSRPD
jgi:hypothetical protein